MTITSRTPGERQTLEKTIAAMEQLHSEGRNHIWAYYTRNLVRPVAIAQSKVDVIVGNPPWLIYRNTASTLRDELERQSRDLYNIWAGGKYAAVQDIAGLFYARCTDLYLKDGGHIGMVMPHSALQTGQYTKWRTGSWRAGRGGRVLTVDFSQKTAWDLERLEPNNFFPVPASVVFAQRTGLGANARRLGGEVECWLGTPGSSDVRRVPVLMTDVSANIVSPYNGYSRKGADIYPRCFYFVEETINPSVVQAGQTVTVNPRRGSQDKKPWRNLDLTAISEQTIEAQHVFDVHLGETVVPYATLAPLQAVLPFKRSDFSLPADSEGVGGVNLGALGQRMRDRWRTVSRLWEENKRPVNKLNLLGRLDYLRELSAQLEWQRNPGDRPVRVVYSGYGMPTAALIHEVDVIVDYKLFWIACKDTTEAYYLLAIINSASLYELVTPLMSKGQFGARDLQKHLWKLSIPEFDSGNSLRVRASQAGEAAAQGVAKQLAQLRQDRGEVTVTIARRELRKWLRESTEGKAAEEAVEKLLGTGQMPTAPPSGGH